MSEVLTRQIATEYRNRARSLPSNSLRDTGERRALRIELQARCNLTELVAINIINGYHIADYVMLEEKKEKERIRGEQEE